MRPLVSFFVPGTPIPKGSHRAREKRRSRMSRVFGGRQWAIVDEPEVYLWQQAVGMVALVHLRDAEPPKWELIDTAVAMDILYVLPRKKSAKPHESCIELAAVKPDLDKCERAIFDALQGVIYTQDSRVTSVRHRKRVAPHGEPEAVGVKIQIGLDTGE